MKLLKKSISFKWGIEQDNAFKILKEKLCSTPLLTLHDFTRTFEIECDFLEIDIRIVLMQEK